MADVRIIALGVLNKPKSTLTINTNAHVFLHPPGINLDGKCIQPSSWNNTINDHGVYPIGTESAYRETDTIWVISLILYSVPLTFTLPSNTYARMTHPLPAVSHANYPWYTHGGGDKRWIDCDEEEDGFHWVGGLMSVARRLQVGH